MDAVIGLTKKSIIQPIKKEVRAKIKKIFTFEHPNIFKVNKSLLFLIFNINHIHEMNITKGKSFNRMLGMIIEVKTILGQTVLIEKMNNETIAIDLSFLKNGVYIIQVHNQKETKTERLILNK